MVDHERRTFLRLLGGTASVGLVGGVAGCSGSSGDGSSGSGGSNPGDAGSDDTDGGSGDGTGDSGSGRGTSDDGSVPDVSGESIAYGDVVEGQLTGDDSRSDAFRGPYDVYTFEGTAGDRPLVTMVSPEDYMDPHLFLLGPDGEQLASDGDGATSSMLGSSILHELGTDGTYAIVAGSFPQNQTFAYELSLVRGGTDVGGPGTSISFGDTVEGELAEGDVRGYTTLDSYVDFYAFEGSADERVRTRMRSDAGDPYLFLEDPDGELLAENDNGGGDPSNNSQITTTLPVDGQYRIAATSYGRAATFAYELDLERVE